MLARLATLLAVGSLTAMRIGVDLTAAPPRQAARSVSGRTAGALGFQRTAKRLARGKYIVEGPAHCFGCHSEIDRKSRPLRPIPGKKGGGRVDPPSATRPFQLVRSNISPDRETGAGTWTDEQFARAIRQGIGHDGRTLYIRMPYKFFHSMSDEDLAAVVVYLRSIPPVRNKLPKLVLPADVAARLQPLPPPGPVPPPDPSDPVKRGAYLVNLAQCAGCHSPSKDEEPIPGLEFSGGNVFTSFSGRALASGNLTIASANLTSDPSGIPYYDEALFIKTMRAGAVGGVRELDTVMPWSYYRLMTDADLKDVFAFLRSLKPVIHRVSNSEPPTDCPLCGHRHGLGERNPLPAPAGR